MSITDELMEYALGWDERNRVRRDLTAIADRIDAEHERGMEERADRYSELRNKMNNCYIELPKDADGEYIHIGDEVETTNFGIVEVEGFVHRAVAFYNYSEQPAYLCTTPANLCRHYHAPTVEDVLCDLLNEYRENECTLEEARLSEYAAKLRLAEGED